MAATTLYKKLGIKENSRILVLNSPQNYVAFFNEFPPNVEIIINCKVKEIQFIHIFVKTLKELEHNYYLAKSSLAKNGMLWISWPKKTSNIETELDKFSIMNYGLNHGLVDTKVASINENWSGHKFVYRLKDRQ